MVKKLLISAVIIFASSCASMTHRGVVAMKVDEQNAHVGMGGGELKVGDHVELFKNVCSVRGRHSGRVCEKVASGHGEVLEILNEDYSVIRFPAETHFAEGDTVEKHRH
jgi:hypothetical protein